MWSAWISTLRYRSISEHSHPVHPYFHTSRISSSYLNAAHCGIGRAVHELTALSSCLGRRAEFSPRQVTRTRLRSICGSKHLVRLHSIFCLSNGTNFLFPAFTLSFFGISISPTLHSDLLLEKLHRNHDLARIRAIGGSAQVSPSSLSPAFANPLTRLSAARSCLVESKRCAKPSRPRSSTQPQQSAHLTMFLNTKCSSHPGYLSTHSCACHRGGSRWSRSYGGSSRNLCTVIPNSGTIIAGP